MSIWIIIGLACFLGLAILKIDWALYLICASLPAYLIRFKIFSLPVTFLEAMILSSFAVWLLKDFWPGLKESAAKKLPRLNYPFVWEILLIIIASFVAVGVSGFSASALGIWKAYFFEPVLLFLMLINLLQRRAKVQNILWALLLSAFAVSSFAIFQKFTGLFISNPFWAAVATRRSVSFFGYPNAIGLFLAPLVMLFIGWLFSFSWRNVFDLAVQKIAILSVTLCSVLAIYFAHSEGAIFGLAAASFIFGLAAGRKLRLATVILSGLLIIGVFAYGPAKNYALDKLSLNDLSGQIRQQQWKETLTMLRAGKIVTGAGLGNYQTSIKPYHQEGIFYNSDNLPNFDAVVWASSTLRQKYWQPVEIYLYPHDIFLNFWSELGLLGLLAFIWLIIDYLYAAGKLSRSNNPDRYLALGLLAAMIAIVVHGLVDVPYFKNDLAAMFWLMIALLGYFKISRLSDRKQNY